MKHALNYGMVVDVYEIVHSPNLRLYTRHHAVERG